MKSNSWKTFVMLVLLVVGICGIIWLGSFTGLIKLGGVSETELSESQQEANIQLANCPDTKQTTASITIKNDHNQTADEGVNTTAYLYKVIGDTEVYDSSITSTIAGSKTLDCLQTYRMKVVSADADGGDNAKLNRIIAPTAGTSLLSGGKGVEFTPIGSSYTLKVGGEKHGVLEFKAFDNVANGWMCNSDDTCTDYEADGVAFESSTNATNITIGSSNEIDVDLHFRSTNTITSFDDFGYYILVEAGTDTATTWQEPVMTLNGNRLSRVSLAGDEARQFQSYDWAFYVEGHDITDADNILRIQMKPQTGQDPSTDLQFDFASVGAYLSVDGSTIKYGAAKDDTSATVVFTVQDTIVYIT